MWVNKSSFSPRSTEKASSQTRGKSFHIGTTEGNVGRIGPLLKTQETTLEEVKSLLKKEKVQNFTDQVSKIL
jgi:hypothetical protein